MKTPGGLGLGDWYLNYWFAPCLHKLLGLTEVRDDLAIDLDDSPISLVSEIP